MKNILLVTVGLLVAFGAVGCKSKKEKTFEAQLEVVRQIAKQAIGLDDDKTMDEIIGGSDLKTGEITNIDLSGRNLTVLPPEIGLLTGLEELNVSGNKLTELPQEIGNLKKLKKLDVSENELTKLPPTIGNLVELESLDLGHNDFRTLPPEFNKLTKLTELFLWRNKLETLPDSLNGIDRITFLNLVYNNFTVFPRSLKTMPNLKEVFLDVHLLDTSTVPEGVHVTDQGSYTFEH